jgi:hypothetical protein
MPIFSNKRSSVFFLHIPRTGGLALEHAFGESLDRLEGYEQPCSYQHEHYSSLDEKNSLDNHDFIFTVIRNPLYRLISQYKWCCTYWSNYISNVPDEDCFSAYPEPYWKHLPFEDFVKISLDCYRENRFTQDNHIRPQADFVGPKVTKVYKFPHVFTEIQSDMVPLGFDIQSPIEPRNETSFSKEKLIVSRPLRKTIREFYEEDYALWEHSESGQ